MRRRRQRAAILCNTNSTIICVLGQAATLRRHQFQQHLSDLRTIHYITTKKRSATRIRHAFRCSLLFPQGRWPGGIARAIRAWKLCLATAHGSPHHSLLSIFVIPGETQFVVEVFRNRIFERIKLDGPGMHPCILSHALIFPLRNEHQPWHRSWLNVSITSSSYICG